jgi:hypothetical protein
LSPEHCKSSPTYPGREGLRLTSLPSSDCLYLQAPSCPCPNDLRDTTLTLQEPKVKE